MAIQWMAGDSFTCLSTDIKPTLVPANTKALETDTDDTYKFNGTSWALVSGAGGLTASSTTTLTNKTMHNDSNIFPFVGAYSAIIYKSGSTYKAKSGDGTLLASSTTLDGVVQTALDQKGLIIWTAVPADGAYTPSTTLPGWEFKSDTHLMMSPNTRITLNKGSTGSVFKINDTYGGEHVCRNVVVSGGKIQEFGSPPDVLWKCFEVTSASTTPGVSGVTNLVLKDIWIKRCNIGLELNSNLNATSWIAGNRFDNLMFDTPYIGIEFNQSNVAGQVNGTIFRNLFSNIIVQASTANDATTQTCNYGVKDISGTNNMFLDCKMWDVVVGHITSNITNKARDTVIMGGLMAWRPFDWEMTQDLGERTWVMMESHFIGSNVSGVTNPFLRKTGAFYGSSGTSATTVVGDGILNALQVHTGGTYSVPTPTDDGTPKRIATGTSAGTVAGIRTGPTPFCRHFDPMVICSFKNESTTSQRIFVGFISSPTAPTLATSDDPLVSLTGYGLYHSTSHPTSATNWLVCRNTGSATSTFVNTGIAANTTAVQTLYIAGWQDPLPAKFQWRIGNTAGQLGEHTTTIPAEYDVLGYGIYIDNITGVDRRSDVFGMFAKEGKSNLGPGGV